MHVTVLIPAYNRENFINEALESVTAQDYQDWDILVVDDGSTDGTAEIVKSKITEGKVSLIRTKHGGCAAALAAGIEQSKGPVITYLGSDDKLLPGALSTALPAFEQNPNLGYLWTNYITSNGEKGICDFLPSNQTLFEAIIAGWWKAWCQQFFRKEFYLPTDGVDVSEEYAVDLQLALLIGGTDCDTMHIPKVTYWYRLHPQRISVEHYSEQLEAYSRLRRKSALASTNPRVARLYIESIEKERDRLRNELSEIRSTLGFRLMQHYGPIIDRALPNGTRRGEAKRKYLYRLRKDH